MLEKVPWVSLGTPKRELTLSNTLPTGQSFRWYRTEGNTFTGVVGERVVRYRSIPLLAELHDFCPKHQISQSKLQLTLA
jgi:hypothetical protein